MSEHSGNPSDEHDQSADRHEDATAIFGQASVSRDRELTRDD